MSPQLLLKPYRFDQSLTTDLPFHHLRLWMEFMFTGNELPAKGFEAWFFQAMVPSRRSSDLLFTVLGGSGDPRGGNPKFISRSHKPTKLTKPRGRTHSRRPGIPFLSQGQRGR